MSNVFKDIELNAINSNVGCITWYANTDMLDAVEVETQHDNNSETRATSRNQDRCVQDKSRMSFACFCLSRNLSRVSRVRSAEISSLAAADAQRIYSYFTEHLAAYKNPQSYANNTIKLHQFAAISVRGRSLPPAWTVNWRRMFCCLLGDGVTELASTAGNHCAVSTPTSVCTVTFTCDKRLSRHVFYLKIGNALMNVLSLPGVFTARSLAKRGIAKPSCLSVCL